MNENLNTTIETSESGEGGRRANTSYYLERKSATILMIFKLAEALSKLCLAILAAFVLKTIVSALNGIFQSGSTVADGKAMVAQFLKTLRVPTETIKQIVDAFPLNITFSSRPVVYVFVISLPFVVIAVLEAIAAIRLRLGKGGTRTIGILQRIYYILTVIGLAAYALTALVLSIFTIVRLGGTLGIMLSTVYVSVAVFFILIGIPTLLYHKYIALYMDDIRYEMETGKQVVRRKNHFQQILTILIVLEVIGAIVSVIAFWSPQPGLGAALLAVTMIGPAAKLLKYICVKCCHRNFMHEDVDADEDASFSHVPQIILIILVILFFAVPNTLLCMQSSKFSDAIVEKVEEFFSNARETVDEMSTVAEQQIQAVESVVNGQIGFEEAAAVPEAAAAAESAAAAAAPQEEAKAGSATAAAAPQEETKPESAAAAAAP